MAGRISGNVAPLMMSGGFIIGDHHDQDHHHQVMVMVGADTTSAGGMLMTEEDIHRLLQDNQRGRTVLTVLYLLVLGMCFVVPVFYYFRMSCDERYQRRLRELELAGITQALEQSQNAHREESRAARRKFREERRARINQLFAPVKMELKEEHFPHLREAKIKSANTKTDVASSSGTTTTTTTIPPAIPEISIAPTPEPSNNSNNHIPGEDANDIEEGRGGSGDEDQLFVELPAPGFQFATSTLAVGQKQKLEHQRLVPNVCSICLCNYYPGNHVVWSSNEACEHVFHEHCILQWIMKQREGPLCPCCRRDFVLDPYDMEDEEIIMDPTSAAAAAVGISLMAATTPEGLQVGGGGDEHGDYSSEEEDLAAPQNPHSSGVPMMHDAVAAAQEAALAMHMEEGLSSASSSNSSRNMMMASEEPEIVSTGRLHESGSGGGS